MATEAIPEGPDRVAQHAEGGGGDGGVRTGPQRPGEPLGQASRRPDVRRTRPQRPLPGLLHRPILRHLRTAGRLHPPAAEPGALPDRRPGGPADARPPGGCGRLCDLGGRAGRHPSHPRPGEPLSLARRWSGPSRAGSPGSGTRRRRTPPPHRSIRLEPPPAQLRPAAALLALAPDDHKPPGLQSGGHGLSGRRLAARGGPPARSLRCRVRRLPEQRRLLLHPGPGSKRAGRTSAMANLHGAQG